MKSTAHGPNPQDMGNDFFPKPMIQGLGSWHKDVAPAKGGYVQVLHADGKWYCGKLTQYDEAKGRWHILFDDGDNDWYTLPDTDVRLLRDRSSGSWGSFLQNYQMRGPAISRDQQRDYFLACQPCETVVVRKPADIFTEGGSLHNPNPSMPPQPETIWPGSPATRPSPPTKSTDVNREDDLYYGVKANKRRRGPIHLPEQLHHLQEAQAFAQLLALERRVDTSLSRRMIEVEESLRNPPARPRRIQLCIYNTFSHQSSVFHGGNAQELNGILEDHIANGDFSSNHALQRASTWTLFITVRVLGADEYTDDDGFRGDNDNDSAEFWDLVEEIAFELPADEFPEESVVRWTAGSRDGKPGCRLRLCRHGSKECGVCVRVWPKHRAGAERRVFLSNPALVSLLGFESGTVSSLLRAFWQYASRAGLVEEREALFLRLDEHLQKAMGGNEDRIMFTKVLERLQSFLMDNPPLASFEYRVHLGHGGSGQSKVTAVEFDVAESAIPMDHLQDFLNPDSLSGLGSLIKDCEEIDDGLESLIDEIDERQRKRCFFRAVASSPQVSLHRCTESLAMDVATLRSDGTGPHCALPSEEVRRSKIWQQPWAEEACLHHLSSLGYDVPLPLDASLLEEDAIAFSNSAIAAANVAADRLASTNIAPLEPAAYSASASHAGGESSGYMGSDSSVKRDIAFCSRCRLRFHSQEALAAHMAFSPAHQRLTDGVRARSWSEIVGASFGRAIGTPEQLPANAGPVGSGFNVRPYSIPSPQAPTIQQAQAPTIQQTQAQAISRSTLSSGQQNNLWNQVQREVKGRGLSVDQTREIYKERLNKMKPGGPG